MARQRLGATEGVPFLLWLQYGSSALASLLLAGYVISLERWMFLCGLVALPPAAISGLFNALLSPPPRESGGKSTPPARAVSLAALKNRRPAK